MGCHINPSSQARKWEKPQTRGKKKKNAQKRRVLRSALIKSEDAERSFQQLLKSR